MAERLRRSRSYSHLSESGIGNEILARQESYVRDPVLRRIQESAWGNLDPKIFLDPWGVPVNIPWALRKLKKWAYE